MRRLVRGPQPVAAARAIAGGVARWMGFRYLARLRPPHHYGKRKPAYLPASLRVRPARGWLPSVPRLTGSIAACPADGWPPSPSPLLDIEAVHRYCRWGWMLSFAGAEHRETLAAHIEASEREMEASPAHPYWEPYSLSERIINVLLVTACLPEWPEPAKIEAFVERSAERLFSCLEYYGPATNNHFLNNARALYLAGAFTGSAELTECARHILERELPVLVPDGCLREASTHYHLLVERWLLDVEWAAAATGDARTAGIVTGVRERMHEISRFFADPDRACVTVGDVSPDMTCDGLREIVTGLYQREWGPDVALPAGLNRDGEWCVWNGGEARALWRLPRSVTPPHPTHAHNDLGGVVLSVGDRPLLIDPGRLDYTKSAIGRYGRTASAHSTVLLGNAGPAPDPVGPFSEHMLAPSTVDAFAESLGDSARVTIRHDGFSRVQPGLTHTRVFECGADELRITDAFSARPSTQWTVLFQLAPEWAVTKDGDAGFSARSARSPRTVHITTPQRVVSCSVASGQLDPIAGWQFPDYGEQQAAHTLRFDFATATTEAMTVIGWS